MRNEISCGVVVMRKIKEELQVLVIKQASGKHWTLCKGHIEPTDDGNLSTAKRELLEEVNLTIKTWLFDEKTFENNYQFERRGEMVNKTNIFFAGIVDDDTKLKIQESEILGYNWDTFKTAIEKVTYDTDKQILIDVSQELEKAKI